MTAVNTKESERIQTTVAVLPASVRTVLEIGFSDGRMSAVLRERFGRCISLDLPRDILDHVTEGRVFGTIAALPFADRSFDAVVCCEVLEHLDADTFRTGLAEIQRVASKAILITVPFEQRLHNERAFCTHCRREAHPYSHVRSFGVEDVKSLIPRWALALVRPFGTPVKGYAPDWMYRLKYLAGGYVRKPWRCPHCHQMSPAIRYNLLTRIVSSVVWRIETVRPQRSPWIMALWTCARELS